MQVKTRDTLIEQPVQQSLRHIIYISTVYRTIFKGHKDLGFLFNRTSTDLLTD